MGHCYQEGSYTLPHQAFVEVFEAVAREPDLNVSGDFNPDLAVVARLVPELRHRSPVELPPPVDPSEDRARLIRAVVELVRKLAAARPLLLVLEDLHDADRGTLDLLLHVSRSLDGRRLLLVGTYREMQVDRTHPSRRYLRNFAAPVHLRGSISAVCPSTTCTFC